MNIYEIKLKKDVETATQYLYFKFNFLVDLAT